VSCELRAGDPLGGWANDAKGATLGLRPRPTIQHLVRARPTRRMSGLRIIVRLRRRRGLLLPPVAQQMQMQMSNQRGKDGPLLTPSHLDRPHCAPAPRVSSRPLLAAPSAWVPACTYRRKRAAPVSHRKSIKFRCEKSERLLVSTPMREQKRHVHIE
jgi:hypothetical protein